MRINVRTSTAASVLAALFAITGCMAPVDGVRAGLTEEIGDAEICGDYEITLYAGQHMDAGTVTVNNDATNVYVTIETDNGWTMNAYHIYLGFGPVPMNRPGAPIPGHFPYSDEVPAGTTSVTVTIPLADFDGACEDELVFAVHAELQRQDGRTVQQETGWNDCDNDFRRGWGSYCTYEVCCEPDDPPDACVYPKWIWRDHADWWGISSVDMGGHTYNDAEMMSLLWTPPWGDASIEVAHQVIGGELNLDAGALMDPGEAADFAAAVAWLNANVDADGELPYDIYSIHATYADGHTLAESLRDYNEGRGSEPLCAWY